MKTLRKLQSELETIPADIAWYLSNQGESLGKQQRYYAQSPQKLKTLKKHALVESAVSSNRIEGISVEGKGVGPLVFGTAQAKKRDDEEIRRYRRAPGWIHSDGKTIACTDETVKKLHTLTRG